MRSRVYPAFVCPRPEGQGRNDEYPTASPLSSAETWVSCREKSWSERRLDVLDGLKIDKAGMAGISFGARIILRYSG